MFPFFKCFLGFSYEVFPRCVPSVSNVYRGCFPSFVPGVSFVFVEVFFVFQARGCVDGLLGSCRRRFFRR